MTDTDSNLYVTEHGERIVVAVRGALDVTRLPDVERLLFDYMEAGYKTIEIDLSRLVSLTVVGAAGLVALVRVLQDGKVDVTMFRPPKECLEPFEDLGVLDLLPFRGSHDPADES